MADREQRTHEEEQPPTSMASSAGSADSVESYSDDDDDDDDDDVSDDEEHTSSGVVVAADDAAVDDEPVTVAATHFLRQRSHLASESETEGDGDELAAYAQGLAHPDVVKLHCGYVPWTDKELKDMADKDKVVVDLDIPANRLSGMIYALRFFVMKPGMWGMTSKSKLLVLSPMNLFVLDPASEATLETIAYADITEVTSSDATSLTINVKGQKDTYVCRDMDTKNHFLSAYYQLYYRERADQATTLFQNPTYLMKKRSKSKGSSANPVDIPVLLEVRRASIDRLDLKTKKTVSSILLTNIVKIHKLRSDPHSLILYYQQDKARVAAYRYSCEEREAFIGVLVNNLRTIVKEPLMTQEVSDASEYDALVYLSDEPAPVTFEMPVLKLSKASAASQKTVHLALTRTQILERDPVTRRTTFKCEMADIFNVVMYTEELGGGDHFALEFKNGRTRRYIALPGAVSVRSTHIGLGLEKVVEAARLKELQAVVMDPTFRTSTAFKSAGSTTILTATATRNLFLSNLFEMIHKNHKHVSWSTEETPLGCKVGLWSQGDVASEWEDHLLKKLHVSWKATHDTQQWFDELFRVLEQFNKNIPVGGLTPTKSVARPLGALLKVLESLKGYIVLKIKDPSVNSHAAIPSPMLQTALLLAIQRLLHTTSGFTEMLRKDYRKYIGIVMEFLYSPVAEVAFAAAGVVQAMVVNYSGDRTAIKMELANRKNVFFSEKRCALFVQRIFDPQAQHTNMYADALVPNKAMNRVLSLDLLGADYLVLSSMLRTLEACMSSGKKATPDVVFSNLLRAMNIESFGSHYTLFAMNRSLSFAITKYSSTLVKVHVLEQPSELVESIQDFARVQGALLWQLYLSVSGHDQSQRRISSQLLALLTHENPRSSNLIRNVFPFALLGDVPAEKMSFDEFGRHLPSAVSASSSSAVPLSSVPDLAARAAPASSPTDPTASARSLLNYDEKNASEKAHAGVTSRFEVVRATKNVVLYPDFFDKIRTEMTQKDLKWNSASLTELQERLMAEISALDINRLKNYYFVLVNPNERTETPIDRALDGVRREPSLLSAQFPSMFSQLDSTTPLPEAQDEAADEKAADEHGHADHADKDALSRVAMKPVWFLNWNANEFQVDYKVTADEVRVGAYYLEYLLATDLADEIVDPEPFMTLLYFRLVASSSDDRVRLLCLKVMTQLYNKYAPMLPSLVFLNPLLATTMDASAWPLTVRGHVMLFAERVLSNAVNVARFLYEPRNVELVLSLLKEVQPLVDQPEAESIVQTCLLVLLKLVHSQTSRGEELVKTEYFVGDDGAPGAAVGPISAIKQCLAQDRHLKFLVTLLAYPNRSVYRQVLHLLHLLVQNNASMVPSLHATGLFYYLILNARNEEEMVWAATFLEKIHLRQRRVHMTPEAVAALLKESPVADDSLTERCLKSWLVKILPVSLIAQLVRHGAAKFASVFFGTSNDPETMWNDAMRSHMTSQVREFVANHLINGVFVLTSNEDDVATPLIAYPEEVYMLQVYQYYLHNLLNEEKFPNWPINDVPAFLRALLESVHAYVYPSSLASKPSFEDLGLIFDAIGLLFRRFWASTLAASIHETINVSTLLMALKKCTETAMPQDVAGWKAFTNLCLVLPTLYKSKEVVALLKDTSVVSGIRVLHGALSTAHEHKDATVTKCLLETFELVLKSPVGRDALAVSSSFNLLPCVTPYLTFDAPTELTLSALLVVQNMALASSASKSDMLVEWLAQNGVLWYLAELICQKHGREAVRREAAEALKRLLRQDAASPSRGRVQRTIELVFTRPLIDLLLCSTDADMFLQVVADDVKKPHMMWTASMRSELLALAAQAHASAREMELPVHFMYEAQKSELRVADIYVNFYNAYPEAGIHALISTGGSMGSEKNSVHVTDQTEIRKRVMANLLSALSHDIAGVRARPEILDAVLNDRMLPVVTAVRHMLQHTPEMDVQLVEVDGIVTLFAGLDHDDTMLRFSSPKAAFFQLRIMECLQIAMFSPKCIERIVEKVPMYVKSLFSLVYTHLPKRKESDEGMLARVTLQVLGNLCLVPTCIDKLVSGMDAAALTHVLPQLTSGNNHNDVELLLNMHTTVLKRHTNLSIAFAKGNSMGPMVTALLNLLAAPDAIAGSTKAPIARFLSVLSIIPGNQVMPVLRDSKLWKDYSSSMDRASMSDSSSDIKKWLVVPAAPALLKFRHANPQKIGVLSS